MLWGQKENCLGFNISKATIEKHVYIKRLLFLGDLFKTLNPNILVSPYKNNCKNPSVLWQFFQLASHWLLTVLQCKWVTEFVLKKKVNSSVCYLWFINDVLGLKNNVCITLPYIFHPCLYFYFFHIFALIFVIKIKCSTALQMLVKINKLTTGLD